MKILIIQPGIGPYRIDFFNQLAKCCELKIIYFFEKATDQVFPVPLSSKLRNCQVERVDGGFNLRTHYPVRPRLNKVIKKFKPDIIVGYEFNTLAMHLIMLKKIFRAKWKLLIWTSDNIEIAEKCKFPRSLFRFITAKMSDGMLLYSEKVKEYYVKHLVSESKTMLLPNIQSTDSIRRKVKDSRSVAKEFQNIYNLTDKKLFLFVGRLHPIKNLSRLIGAWKGIAAEFDKARLIIVGSGPLENEFKQQIYELNLNDSIIMTGACYDRKLWAWFYLADCFILPSVFEPFGAVVNEALAAGIRCLVSNRAGSRVLIKSDKQGYLIDPDSIEDIQNKIKIMYSSCSRTNKNNPPESLMPWKLEPFVDNFMEFCKFQSI